MFALLSTGTNDVGAFFQFGEHLRAHGLGSMYRADPAFNHLPAVALLSAVTSSLAQFPFWLRLPGILADLVTVKALVRADEEHGLVPWWALALLAASPVSLFVSGFHGNVDSIMTMALVLAVIAVTEDRPVASAAWLAVAANVKVAALLLAPLLLAVWWHRHRSRSFVPVLAGLTLLGWSPALLTAPREFVDQVLGYSSRWGTWGLTYLARQLGGASMQTSTEFGELTSTESILVAALKAAIVIGTVLIAWRGRAAGGRAIWTGAAATWLVFFALAPGVGPQYLVWLAPFVAVASPRGYIALTSASTVGLVAFYGITSGWRFDFAHSTNPIEHEWLPWMCLPWVVILGLGIQQLRIRDPRPERQPR